MKKVLAISLFGLALTSCAQPAAPLSTSTVLPPSSFPTISSTPAVNQLTGLVSGSMKRADLHLVPLATDPSDSPDVYTEEVDGVKTVIDPSRPRYVSYTEVGTYTSGPYQGYKRILVMEQFDGPGEPMFAMLITKDNQTYIFDTSLETSLNQTYATFDSAQVTSGEDLPTDHPEKIILNSQFVLVRGSPYYYINYETGNTESIRDLSDFRQLDLPNTALKLYSRKPATVLDMTSNSEKYFDGTRELLGIDNTGLIFNYTLATPASLKAYETSINTDTFDYMPAHFAFPQARVQSTSLLYSSYDAPFSKACTQAVDPIVTKNIDSTDLTKIGVVDGIELFALKDSQHPLIKESYEFKIVDSEDSTLKAQYREMAGQSTPTFAQYAAKNPLVFFKDYWGSLLMLQEDFYAVPHECGKPVIYLYPEDATPVTVQFQKPMRFSAVIPAYHQQWKVLAQPNGELKDLQPQYTICSDLGTDQVGHEYAAQACEDNKYPYLYWAGHVIGSDYPTPAKGWLVAQADLENFMNKTLDSVGLSAQEKDDMLEYWLPAMQVHNAPYYRISFLQTAEMNRLAPMKITPTPKSVFRIFLDYQPLESADLKIQPQNLEKVQRDGFTVVEWGGLKR